MDTFLGNMELKPDDNGHFESIFPRGLNGKCTKAIELFFQLAFGGRLNLPQITRSKLKTKIIFPDHEFKNSVFLNCCFQSLYMLLKCGRQEEVIGYNRPFSRNAETKDFARLTSHPDLG